MTLALPAARPVVWSGRRGSCVSGAAGRVLWWLSSMLDGQISFNVTTLTIFKDVRLEFLNELFFSYFLKNHGENAIAFE